MDIGMRNKFEVKRLMYTKSPPMPINHEEDLIVDSALTYKKRQINGGIHPPNAPSPNLRNEEKILIPRCKSNSHELYVPRIIRK